MIRWFLPLLAGLLTAGCASKSRVPPESIVRVRFMLEAADNRSLSLELPRSGVRIAVNPQPVVTEFDVIEAAVAQVEMGRCLMFRLTPSATRDLYRLTGTNQGSTKSRTSRARAGPASITSTRGAWANGSASVRRPPPSTAAGGAPIRPT